MNGFLYCSESTQAFTLFPFRGIYQESLSLTLNQLLFI